MRTGVLVVPASGAIKLPGPGRALRVAFIVGAIPLSFGAQPDASGGSDAPAQTLLPAVTYPLSFSALCLLTGLTVGGTIAYAVAETEWEATVLR